MLKQILRVLEVFIYHEFSSNDDKYLPLDMIQKMSGWLTIEETQAAINELKKHSFLCINYAGTENETYRIASIEQFGQHHK